VTVVLSGMSDMAQVAENLKSAENGLPDSLSKKEMALYGKVRKLFKSRMKVECSGCGYCMPCPNGVDIPGCFELYNSAYMYEDTEHAKQVYGFITRGGSEASKCKECGKCEELCPQGIPIPERLKEVGKLFGK
jgi:predicted aldo/keto reductase-like oxidoreductase